MAPPAVALRARAPSLYEHVGLRLHGLVGLLALESMGPTIADTFELLCSESLALPCDRRSRRASHLNADGTPFQFSLTLGAGRPGLQFLTETGRADASTGQRLAASRERVGQLAAMFGAGASLSPILEALDEMVPSDDPDLLADEAGATWLGAGFSADADSTLKLYMNARWGPLERRWARLDAFAARARVAGDWHAARETIEHDLQPLGVALSVARDRAPTARIYVAGYGRPFSYYERLAEKHGGNGFAAYLARYARAIVQEDYAYPTRSVVCSFGVHGGRFVDFKVELCAHCVLDSDEQALLRCRRWMGQADVDPAPYLQLVELLSGGKPDARRAQLHSYMGVGIRGRDPYATFYFNPALPLR